jgi:xanthine dehydrogenase small subunit
LLSCSSSKAVFVNGIREIIKDVNYDITLLDWLRNNLQITGTKEGCAEGDCGACSVLINEGKNFAPKPVNSCLLRLGQVIGKNIITIEGIGTTENPHPLQIAFSKQNASQCGYCTPGFIVSAFALLNSNKKINNKTIHDTFSGNLCRCTGYSPIVRAVKSTTKKSFKNKYKFFDEEIKNIKLGNVTYYNPKSLNELKNLTKLKNYKFLAGGTDLNLQRPVISENENILILLNSIEELKKIKFYENKILLGSLVSIENLLELIEGKMPEMTEVLQRFGSPQIRNQATIGGNLFTSSPI